MLLSEIKEGSGGSFMYLSTDIKAEASFELKMLEENDIEGLISFSVRNQNGAEYFIYDISGMLSLKKLYEERELGCGELTAILRAVSEIYESIAAYLIDETCLLLDPEYIFMDLYSKRVRFVCFPPQRVDIACSMGSLADFLIRRTDHGDAEAVRIAYEYYRRVFSGNYFVGDLVSEPEISAPFTETAGISEKSREAGADSDIKAVRPAGPVKAVKAVKAVEPENINPKRRSRAVYLGCFTGLSLLTALVFIIAVYDPYGLSSYLYEREVIASVAGTGAMLAFIAALNANKSYKEKAERKEGTTDS